MIRGHRYQPKHEMLYVYFIVATQVLITSSANSAMALLS